MSPAIILTATTKAEIAALIEAHPDHVPVRIVCRAGSYTAQMALLDHTKGGRT